MKHYLGIFLIFFACSTGMAQSNYSTIRGTITDSQEHAIPAATVSVTSTATAFQRTTKSNGTGIFEISGLQPGEYTLRVEAAGFASATTTVKVEVGQRLTSDFALKARFAD